MSNATEPLVANSLGEGEVRKLSLARLIVSVALHFLLRSSLV